MESSDASTTTGNDVELILGLELEMGDAEKCEHSGHWWRRLSHSDDSGAWLVMSYCPCHDPHEVIFCGKFKAWCESRTDIVLDCIYCGRLTSPAKAYRWIKQL